MILMLGSSGIFLIFLCWLVFAAKDCRDSEHLATFFSVIFGVICLVIFISWGISRWGTIPAEIKQFEATQETIAVARNNPAITPFELAAIQQKVVEANKWLASAKFWAKSPLTNWFWPKKIFELEPIK